MKDVAQFGAKRFAVSSGKVNTFTGLTLTSSLATEAKAPMGKKPTTTIKGPGLNQIKLSAQLMQALGMEPLREIEEWIAIKDAATPFPFLLGSSAMGENKYLLTRCDVSETEVAPGGLLVSAKLALTFEEYLPPGPQPLQAAAVGGAPKATGLGLPNPYNVRAYGPAEKASTKRVLPGGGR